MSTTNQTARVLELIKRFNEGQKICIVLEEAHTIIPETNFLATLGEENGKAIPDYGTCAVKHSYAADKWAYVMMLPMKEFTSNPNFTPDDQNPAW